MVSARRFVTVLAISLWAAAVWAGSAHWGYGEHDGPAVWAELSPDYGLCAEGREQSPIDLRNAQPREHPPVALAYQPQSLRMIRHEHVVDVIDNGHTIQVSYDEGSVLTIGEKQYELAQYHFHAPSEHTVAGKHSPMEMHLVHKSTSGELAVLGVLIAEGAHNTAFDPVWSHLPRSPGEKVHLEHVKVQIDALLPTGLRHYRYRGSLTTPPCTEGVSWLVAESPVELSGEQIAAFTAIIRANNRPVQELGERTVGIDPPTDEDPGTP